MASIDDLFDDEPLMNTDDSGSLDEGFNLQDTSGDQGNDIWNDSEGSNEDVITTLLRKLGIVDPNRIKFEREDGELEERAWDDLSSEEQINILSGDQEYSDDSDPEDDLDDDEINLINSVRLANITPELYLQLVREQAIKDYLLQSGTESPTYTVDDYTDDELFIYDMQVRMPDLTEEELTLALESAKANEVVFDKLINGLRAEYKKLEDNKIQLDLLMLQQQQLEEYNRYANAVLEGISQQEDIAGVFELEDDDRQMLAQFILGQDLAGISLLGKALNDPQTLVEMSWFALKGKEAIDSINEYYKEEITKARKAGYAKGLEDGKKGNSVSSKVVTKKRSKLIKRGEDEPVSIDELDFD